MFALTLPLIIAHGKFTMLDDMKDDEMESFVSFLVKCDKNCSTHIEEPPWWLPNLPFVHPIKRPNKVTRKWRHKLKSLIKKCYKYYDCELLIDLSAKLAHEQKKDNIKFIVKCSHLTSVYNNAKSMIIVTIRNENLTYDLEDLNDKFYQTRKLNRMCYSCNRIADVVVENSQRKCKLEPEDLTPPPTTKESFTQNDFLNMFELSSKENNSSVFVVNPPPSNYGRINFTKAPHIPFSSQLGRRLATKVKYFVQDTTHMKRLERIGRYLNTSPTPTLSGETSLSPPVIHPKHSHRWYHTYKFPGKTYNSHLRNYSDRTFFLKSKCTPCTVNVIPFDLTKENSEQDVFEYIDLTEDFDEFETKEIITLINNDVSDAKMKQNEDKKITRKATLDSDSKKTKKSNILGPVTVIDEQNKNNLIGNTNKIKKDIDRKGNTFNEETIIMQKRTKKGKRPRRKCARRDFVPSSLKMLRRLRSRKKKKNK